MCVYCMMLLTDRMLLYWIDSSCVRYCSSLESGNSIKSEEVVVGFLFPFDFCVASASRE